jgi:hypothetical protein
VTGSAFAGFVPAPPTCSKSARSMVAWPTSPESAATRTFAPAEAFCPNSNRASSKKWCVLAPGIHDVST